MKTIKEENYIDKLSGLDGLAEVLQECDYNFRAGRNIEKLVNFLSQSIDKALEAKEETLRTCTKCNTQKHIITCRRCIMAEVREKIEGMRGKKPKREDYETEARFDTNMEYWITKGLILQDLLKELDI